MSVHKKLMQARVRLQQAELKKSGHNKFAGYQYFELADFLPTVQVIFENLGLCSVVSFTADMASLAIIDTDAANSQIVFTSPMGSASLKGCHEVQNIGAVESYQRRYLYMAAMEIVEHDALDSSEPLKEPKRAPIVKPTAGALENLSEDDQAKALDTAAVIQAKFDAEDEWEAFVIWEECPDDVTFKTAVWDKLDSKCRASIKKQVAAAKEKK